MSTLTIRQLPSGNYNARVYSHTEADGKRHYKSITAGSKVEVKRLAAAFIADRDSIRAQKKEASPTLGEAIDRYISLKSNVLSPSTLREYKSERKNIDKKYAEFPVRDITQEWLQELVNDLAANHAPKTVRNIHALITAALAVPRPDLRSKATLPRKVNPNIAIPSEEEIKALFAAAKGTDMEIPVYLAACCGLRRSEICALRWTDFNESKQTLLIQSALVAGEKNEYKLKSTKTTAGKRLIRIMPAVAEALKAASHDSDKIVAMPPHQITDHFAILLKQAGIRHYASYLRHTPQRDACAQHTEGIYSDIWARNGKYD